MNFAERNGYRSPRQVFQNESLDDKTRTLLWNVLNDVNVSFEESFAFDAFEKITYRIWTTFWILPGDEYRNSNYFLGVLKNRVLHGEWFDVLSEIEYVYESMDYLNRGSIGVFTDEINQICATCLVGYRLVSGKFIPTTSDKDLEIIENGLKSSKSNPSVQHHLQRSLELLSDRNNPDYLNSVKEAISAVEVCVREKTGAGTLSSGLKLLSTNLHPALRNHLDSLYGWTSAEPAIRHGGNGIAQVDSALAIYVVSVSCAAVTFFNNFD